MVSLSSSLSASGYRGLTGQRYADMLLAMLTLLVIVMMVLPMPPWALDLLVAANIGAGITLLLFALYVATPTAFSTFPSILLFTTLFRIALNVATTRQILLNAHGGEIIDTFGNMVVGGSLLVGMVIFLIITIVQFVVIAKGSERVAEVGARFTLDAMPGKQIAIDSDLRAGLISQDEALEQRRQLGLESQFYGSMDGAMKFVKGDAIASMVIVAINLLGGIAIGMLSMNMSASEAVATYSVLSVGDGLVTQIPALFVSLAAGIVVTRSPDDDTENLATQISRQFGAQPRSLLLAGAAISSFALVPGFPVTPFLVVGAVIALLGFQRTKTVAREQIEQLGKLVPMATRDGDNRPQRFVPSADADYAALALEVHTELLAAIDIESLNRGLARVRERWRFNFGSPFPGVGLRHSGNGAARQIDVLLTETIVAAEEVPAGASPEEIVTLVIETLERVAQRHVSDLLGIQETRWLLAEAERQYPDLVRESGRVLELPQMANLLAALLADGISLRDMRTILESVVDQSGAGLTPMGLAEQVRQSCSRMLCQSCADEEGHVRIVTLSAASEEQLRTAVLPGVEGYPAQWSPSLVTGLIEALRPHFETEAGPQPVLLASSQFRSGLSMQLRAFGFPIRVFSPAEIPPGFPVSPVATISLPIVKSEGNPDASVVPETPRSAA